MEQLCMIGAVVNSQAGEMSNCMTEIYGLWVRREGGVKMCARTRAGAADTTQAVRCDRCRRAGVWSPRYERLEKEI